MWPSILIFGHLTIGTLLAFRLIDKIWNAKPEDEEVKNLNRDEQIALEQMQVLLSKNAFPIVGVITVFMAVAWLPLSIYLLVKGDK